MRQVLTLILAFWFFPGQSAYSQESGRVDGARPFDIQVSKFDTLNGGTFRLNIDGERSGLIQTQYGKARSAAVAPDVFRGWVEKYHPSFAQLTTQGSPGQVIEVKGQWDKADRPLTAMGIPHTTIPARHLDDIDLSACRVLVINCAGTIPRDARQKVRDFVANGGALLTTDWSLHNMLEACFPGYVRWNGWKSKSEVVDAEVLPAAQPLARGLVSNAGWKLDLESQTIAVLDRQRVRVLARSSSLARQEPDKQGILAVLFPFGRGQVLHLIGHFDNNAFFAIRHSLPDPAPVIGISLRQALAGNFVLNALAEPSGKEH